MLRAALPLMVWTLCCGIGLAQPQGSLVIIGSNLRRDETKIWQRIVELAGGPGAKIAIFPTASETPIAEGKRVSAFLKEFGAEPFVVPLAVRQLPEDPRGGGLRCRSLPPSATSSRRVLRGRVAGIHRRHTTGAKRSKTPLLEAVWDVYRGGGVIVGCSAGRPS